MMYGHVDTPRHWVGHLQRPARHPGPHRWFHRVRAAAVRAPATRRCTWPAWPGPAHRTATTGPCTRWPGSCCTGGSPTSRPAGSSSASSGPQVMLNGGANDLGGTLMEETISPDGRLRARLGQDGGRAGRHRRRHRPAGAAAHHDLRQARGLILRRSSSSGQMTKSSKARTAGWEPDGVDCRRRRMQMLHCHLQRRLIGLVGRPARDVHPWCTGHSRCGIRGCG